MSVQTLRGARDWALRDTKGTEAGWSIKLLVVWIFQVEGVEVLVFDAQWSSHVECQVQILLACMSRHGVAKKLLIFSSFFKGKRHDGY
ncbi:hypothetical protein JOS77_28610 [Chromobacterium haemolyticum]|nr:hypothetical protein JOS77_28610 [Chromobacterium haemolyticum]